jgi:beta-phosphoglucomutase
MTLQAVLFDFNGVIINDEPIHAQLLEKILLEENLRMTRDDFQRLGLGRSDRACLIDLLTERGRMITPKYIEELIVRKGTYYREQLSQMVKLPIYPDLHDFIFRLQSTQCKLAVVSGALRSEIELVLDKINLRSQFDVIVAGDEINASKPEPDGYLLAVERLKQKFPALNIQANQCLAIEDTFPGLEAAKRAGIMVVGIAHTYPFHMMQRRSNWAVDYFTDLEIDRIQTMLSGQPDRAPAIEENSQS